MGGGAVFNQFDQVAGELGWDLEAQVAVLEDFVTKFGSDGRLEDFLRDKGLAPSIRFHRAVLRDQLLAFVEVIGAEGAMNRELQRALREAALEEACQRAQEAAQRAAEEKASSYPRRRLWGLFRRSSRPRAH